MYLLIFIINIVEVSFFFKFYLANIHPRYVAYNIKKKQIKNKQKMIYNFNRKKKSKKIYTKRNSQILYIKY